MKKNVVIIPARGGSKGIPRKNIIPFAGKPLIAWSIEQALGARSIDAVFVSTDDDEIARVSESYGAQIIPRPPELAHDASSSEDALLHAVDYIENQLNIEIRFVIFLQATSPLREASDIDLALAHYQDVNADSLFSCRRISDFFIWKPEGDSFIGVNYDYKKRKPRQQIEPRFLENGSIYIFTPHLLRTEKNRLGGKIAVYEMPLWKSFQIDQTEDIELCEYYITKKLVPFLSSFVQASSPIE